MNATELAPYVIAYNDEFGDLITNKKLQKLLYYIAAWGLVYFEDGIVDDDFVAWVHGPVCVAVYNEYRSFGYSPLKIDYNGQSASEYLNVFCDSHKTVPNFAEKIDLINEVLRKYIPYSSLQLELLSHSEGPWKEARQGLMPIDKGNTVINKNAIKKFYKELIDAQH